jgi:adenylylsulfate kinase
MMGAFTLVALLLTTEAQKSQNIYEHEGVSREQRWKSVGHKGISLWLTGLSGSGKSTISVALEKQLVKRQARPYFVYRLDGDNLRFGLNSDLGFSAEDRKENVRRVAEVAKLFADAGAITLSGLISPFKADREFAREVHKNASLPFIEVFVDAPLSVLEQRDPKGLYKKVREGKIKGFTGIDAPYEAPENPDIHIKTETTSVSEAVNIILSRLEEEGLHLNAEFNMVEDPLEAACAAP